MCGFIMANFTFMDRVWGNMMGTGFFPLIIMHVYHDHLRSTIVNHGQPLRTPVPFFTRQHSNTIYVLNSGGSWGCVGFQP